MEKTYERKKTLDEYTNMYKDKVSLLDLYHAYHQQQKRRAFGEQRRVTKTSK